MTDNTQHTPLLQHTQKCVYNYTWEKNNTFANVTEKQPHTLAQSNLANGQGKNENNALSAEPMMSNAIGQKSNQPLSQDMAANAHVAASNIHSFLQSITLKETVESIEKQVFAVGDFTNCLSNLDSRKTIIDCFVTTVIVHAANLENARTKRDFPRLIAAAPTMLAEIEKQIEWLKHVKTQITAPGSVMIGLDQSIKYLELVSQQARGE